MRPLKTTKDYRGIFIPVFILVEPLIFSKIWILAPKTAKNCNFLKWDNFQDFFSIVMFQLWSTLKFPTEHLIRLMLMTPRWSSFFAPQKERIMKEIQCQLCDKCWWTTPYNSLHLCDAFQGFKGVQKQPFKHEKINWYTTF